LEAAGYRGKPAGFSVVSPWTRPERMQAFQRTRNEQVALLLLLAILVLLLVAGGVLARRHLRSGRSDRRGAFRVAAFAFVVGLMAWCFRADHVPALDIEFTLVRNGLASALVLPFVLWVFYLALEPYARRIWPETLISWARLLEGGLHDARVGRDALVGTAWGALLAVLILLMFVIPPRFGLPGPAPEVGNGIDMLLSPRHALALALDQPLSSLLYAMGSMLILVFARLLLKKVWLTGLAFVAVQTVPRVLSSDESLWLSVPLMLIVVVGFLAVIVGNGLLAAVVGAYVVDLLLASPMTGDLSGWPAIGTVFPALVVMGLALHAFRAATSGQSRWRPDTLSGSAPEGAAARPPSRG
jgi:hypothetical protein